MRCVNCNNKLNKGETFCNKCGKPVDKVTNNNIIIYIIVGIISMLIGFAIGFSINKKEAIECPKCTEELNQDKKENEYGDIKLPEKVTKEINIDNIQFNYEDSLAQNIEIVSKLYRNNQIYILAKNNNSEPLEVKSYLNFINDQNQRIDRTIDTEYVNSGKYFILSLTNAAKEEYKDVNVLLIANKIESYMHFVDIKDKDLKVLETSKEMEIQYKNNTKNESNMKVTGIFYKDNKIIYFSDTYITTKPSDISKGSIYYGNFPNYTYNMNYKDLYDNYKIDISGSYYWDSEY